MAPRIGISYRYITMLRGFAALTVTMGHVLGMVPPDHSGQNIFEAPLSEIIIWPILFGREMVWVFIFISGFTLYRSISIQRNESAKSGVKAFFKRRLIRILPTYYLGLFFGLIVVLLGSRFEWDQINPSRSLSTFEPITKMGVVSHLLLIHNVQGAWVHQINPPLWSIAVEMQLYLLLILFFTKIGKKFPIQTALVILAVTKLEMRFTHFQFFTYVEWFLAGVIFSAFPKKTFSSLKYIPLIIIPTSMLAYSRIFEKNYWLYAVTWLILISALFVFLHNYEERGGSYPPKISSMLTRLGECSYSLYVSHFPAALLSWWFVSRFSLSRELMSILMLSVSIPLIAIATYLSYTFFEKRSLQKLADLKT